MEAFLSTETLVIELLLIVSLVAIAVRRLRVPYTVALVIVGLLLTTQQPIDLRFTPELILGLLVPPLVFEAAFHLNVRELRRNLAGVLLLTVPGVIITTLIVGRLVGFLTPLSLPLALVFGALISATDPVGGRRAVSSARSAATARAAGRIRKPFQRRHRHRRLQPGRRRGHHRGLQRCRRHHAVSNRGHRRADNRVPARLAHRQLDRGASMTT